MKHNQLTSPYPPRNRQTPSLGGALRIAAAACLLGGTSTINAQDLDIVDLLHFDVSGEEVEGLDVTKDGRNVAATSPVEMVVEVDGEEYEFFESSLTKMKHNPNNPKWLHETVTIDLNGGELTDLAIGPHGSFHIANVRDDDLFEENQLLVIRGRSIRKRIDLPDSADGLALSPSGNRLVLAGEKYDSIDIFDTSKRAQNVRLLKRIGFDDFAPFFVGEEDRIADGEIEPEAVAFTPDGSLACVSLQEQSSVAIVDMESLELVNVVHLPFGFLVDVSDDGDGSEFEAFGVEPDGLGVTPDGNFLITANETDGDSQHLAGISVIDLRSGPGSIPTPVTYCIWGLDPTLLDGTGVVECPVIPPGVEPTSAETEAIRALPRIDPNATKTVVRQGKSITVVNIERATEAQDRGSVLFLDTSDLDVSGIPEKLDRVLVGLNPKARPEGLRTSNDGRFIWVGLQRDGGTIARFELAE